MSRPMPEDRFDLVWILERNNARASTWAFSQIAQRLLPVTARRFVDHMQLGSCISPASSTLPRYLTVLSAAEPEGVAAL